MVRFLDNNLAVSRGSDFKFAMVILISMLLGIFSYVSPGAVFCVFLTFFLFYAVNKNTYAEDRRYVLSVMVVGLALRFVTIIVVQYYCVANGKLDIFGDSGDNLLQGWDVRNFLIGVPGSAKYYIEDIWSGFGHNVHGKTMFNAMFFLLFGKSILSLKYINLLCVAASGWLVYDLTRKIYSGFAGKVAMSIVIFWPTLFIWSITDLKENHFILALLSILWCIDKLKEKRDVKIRIIFLVILTILTCYTILLKFTMMLSFQSLFFSIISTYFVLRWYFNRPRRGGVSLFFWFVIILGVCLYFYRGNLFNFIIKYYSLILGKYQGSIDTAGWNFDIIGDPNQNMYTMAFFIRYLLNAWFHFFTEPLPWHIYSFNLLAIYPMMLVWYIMLLFSFSGIINLYKSGKFDLMFPSLLFLILYSTVVGMSVANIGTLVRFRDTIMPIIAIFASCGLIRVPK